MFDNPRITWKELEQQLSGTVPSNQVDPNFSHGVQKARSKRPLPTAPKTVVPYAELHSHTNFSFLDGASHPEDMVEEAVRLGLSALAVTDHDGFYGSVRFARAAAEAGLPTIFGSELSLSLPRVQNGIADPEGNHLVVLARNPAGYASLARVISQAQMRGKEKGKPTYLWEDLASHHNNNWVVLTGCRKGTVPLALHKYGVDGAERELRRLIDTFGRDNVAMELWDHNLPTDTHRNDTLTDIAARANVFTVATSNAHYATTQQRPLATALAAVRARRSLDDMDGWLPPAATMQLRSGKEQAVRFARYRGAVERATELGLSCAFDLQLIAPQLPDCGVPDHHDEASWLRELTMAGALNRYGPPNEYSAKAYAQIEHELRLIEQLNFPGYFLIIWDIVQFCTKANIFCQGRGSAANSAVCYALGITNADAVKLGLLFERFLAPERDGPPDIDIDIESDRREEVIQYVYERYGRERAAQVCNVITYRPKSAVRDMAKAFGHSPGQQDAWSKQIDSWGPLIDTLDHDIPSPVMKLAGELQYFPRHLGIHSGGMVLCDRPVVEVCPVEWGRMENRTVLQWDKEDCATAGLVKFDLLGLGMLSVLHYAVDLIKEHHDVDVDIATLDQDSAVYDMLCQADTIGVFQVESRAQMATLPRLKPRVFYDLVVEVALIRPGPIQGGSVHPYIRRRNGQEPVTYLHPLLEKSLGKTLGVPLFQEQLMQMAIDIAGFTPGEADQLRQAMGSKRSIERMQKIRSRLYEGMAERGVTGDVADRIYEKLAAFANFGFPESHSVSFAYLVYASAWIKLYYPDCFLAALLKAQPMGFYSPQTLAADARRHGVVLHGPDVNRSKAMASIDTEGHVRTGLNYVRHIGEDLAEKIEANAPYESMEDVVRRNELNISQVESLATAGAFKCFGLDRRSALWTAGAVVQSRPGRLAGMVTGSEAPQLPVMTGTETASADLWAIGMTPDTSPVEFARPYLNSCGALTAAQLKVADPSNRVWVGGVVTHRQRPATAQGTTFINLEDETGMINVIVSRGVWARYRRIARQSPALMIRGKLERYEGVINIIADKIQPLALTGEGAIRSRDFH